MDIKKINLQICKELLNKERVCVQFYAEDDFVSILAIPSRGTYGYFLKLSDIIFNLDNLKEIPIVVKKIADLSIINAENRIKPTPILHQLSGKKLPARKFITRAGATWVDMDFIKHIDIDSCRFYQKQGDRLSMIVVTEDNLPVMCVLPMKIQDTYLAEMSESQEDSYERE